MSTTTQIVTLAQIERVPPQRDLGFYKQAFQRLESVLETYEGWNDALSESIHAWADETPNINVTDLDAVQSFAVEKTRQLATEILIDPFGQSPLQSPLLDRKTWVWDAERLREYRALTRSNVSPHDGQPIQESPHSFAIDMKMWLQEVGPDTPSMELMTVPLGLARYRERAETIALKAERAALIKDTRMLRRDVVRATEHLREFNANTQGEIARREQESRARVQGLEDDYKNSSATERAIHREELGVLQNRVKANSEKIQGLQSQINNEAAINADNKNRIQSLQAANAQLQAEIQALQNRKRKKFLGIF